MSTQIERKHIGKRVLLRKLYSGLCGDEAVIKEISPNNEYVKIKWESGICTWENRNDYLIDDFLADSD